MNIYLITIFGAVFLAYCAEKWPSQRKSEINPTLNRFWLLALILFLIIISGYRYQNYDNSDEYGYRYMVLFTMGESFNWSKISLSSEWLFDVLVWISANVFESDQALILLCAVITNVLIVLFFAKYAKTFWFSIFLYITSGAFVSSMNVLRQYLSLAIILWCYPLAKRRKVIPYVLLVGVAAFFHQSAWIMLPVYFILRRKKFDIGTVFILFAAILLLINFEGIMALVLPNTLYDHYLDNILSGHYGVKLIRVAAWLVPYLILLCRHDFFHKRCDVDYSVLYAALVAACIAVISTQYVLVARIESYFSLVTFLAIPRIPYLFSNNGSRNFVRNAMLLLFFLFGMHQYSVAPEYHNVLFENISGVL